MSTTHLPLGIKPTHYALTLTPSLETRTFTGTTTIKLHISSTTISLKLHTLDLTIQSVALLSSSGQTIDIAGISTNKNTQTFKILLDHHVPANTDLVLTLGFEGKLRTDGEGVGWFLPGAGQAGGGFLVSQFEPMWARAVFPCYDDPGFKAVFSISMVVPKHFTALSNMPVKSTQDLPAEEAHDANGKAAERTKIVRFEDTPLMATYLLAFAVGQFSSMDLPPLGDEKVLLRAYVPNGTGYAVDQCRFGLHVARRCINILSALLDFPFPLPKLDLLLVPGMSGGMENWGLITLSAKQLLVAPDNSAADKISITQMIAHEIAHSWFGNLVTPRSWSDFWFKEGLSEWAELEIRERMGGNMEPYQDWVAEGLQHAMYVDAWRNMHPLEVKIGDGEDEVEKPFFDALTYRKGCAVIRMLSNYLGAQMFVQGLKLFLRLNAFGNVDSEDLWNAMSQASGADIGAFMRPWTRGMGIPLVEVEETGQHGRINFKQSTFWMLKPDDRDEEENLLPIPLEIVTAKGVCGEILKTKAKTIKVSMDFYTVNAGEAGLFRVVYSPSLLQRICKDMCKGNLSVEDRIGLISNSAALTFSGHSSTRTSDLLNLLQTFEDDESFFVWREIIAVLGEIKKCLLFEDEKARASFEKFWKHLVRRCLYRKGQFSADDDLNEQRFKAMMFSNSGGDEKVFAAAELMFDRFVKKEGKSINPNLRAEVFKIILSRRGKKEYIELKRRLKDASVAERNDILCSLGYSQESSCIKKTIERAMSAEAAERNERMKMLKSLSTHSKGVIALWKYISSGMWMQNPQLSIEKMSPVGVLVFSSYTKREQSKLARKYLATLGDMSSIGPDLQRGFDVIEVKARWWERDKDNLMDWLYNNGYSEAKIARQQGIVTKCFQGLWGSIRE